MECDIQYIAKVKRNTQRKHVYRFLVGHSPLTKDEGKKDVQIYLLISSLSNQRLSFPFLRLDVLKQLEHFISNSTSIYNNA
jgi:hypothetical protein